MPFTFDGQWIPTKKEYLPIKVYKEKRRGSFMTLVKNLPLEGEELKQMASEIKKHLASGGGLKGDVLEIQGDKVDLIIAFLSSRGMKVSVPKRVL